MKLINALPIRVGIYAQKFDVKLKLEGHVAKVNPSKNEIFLPYPKEGLEELTLGFACQSAASFRYGDWKVNDEYYDHCINSNLFKGLHSIIEEFRTNREFQGYFKGVNSYFEEISAHIVGFYPEYEDFTLANYLDVYIRGKLAGYRACRDVVSLMETWGNYNLDVNLKKQLDFLLDSILRIKSQEDGLSLTKEILALLMDYADNSQDGDSNDNPNGESQKGDSKSSSKGKGQKSDSNDDSKGDDQEDDSNDESEGDDQEGDSNDESEGDDQEGDSNDDAEGDDQEGDSSDESEGDDQEGDSNDESEGDDQEGDSNDDAEGDDQEGDSNDESEGDDQEGDSSDDAEGDDQEGDSSDDAEGDDQEGDSNDESEGDDQEGDSSDESEGDGQEGDSNDDAEGDDQEDDSNDDAEGDSQKGDSADDIEGDSQEDDSNDDSDGDSQKSDSSDTHKDNSQQLLDDLLSKEPNFIDSSDVVAKILSDENNQDESNQRSDAALAASNLVDQANVIDAGIYGEALIQKTMMETSLLRNRLRGLIAAESRTHKQILKRGRKLDGNKINRLFVGRLDVFAKKNKSEFKPNSAISLLVDCSGSIGHAMPNVQKAAYTLIDVLTSVPGVVTSGFAFGGMYTNSRLKYFHESAKISAGRIEVLTPDGGTPLEKTLYKGAQDLYSVKGKKRVLLVLTDGQPENGPKCTQIIKEMQSDNVLCIGIGMGKAIQEQNLKNTYGEGNYILVKEFSELAGEMIELSKRMIFSTL